jgi:hypothetical protein
MHQYGGASDVISSASRKGSGRLQKGVVGESQFFKQNGFVVVVVVVGRKARLVVVLWFQVSGQSRLFPSSSPRCVAAFLV